MFYLFSYLSFGAVFVWLLSWRYRRDLEEDNLEPVPFSVWLMCWLVWPLAFGYYLYCVVTSWEGKDDQDS
jgi:hypothetical protein